MSGFSSQGSRPYLKPDCGMVLQRAWNDGLWSSAITMAKQKSKATKDPYYEAVEVAARSQLDNPLDMVAGRDAVEKLLKSKTPFKDSEAIDLYEFATSYSQTEYGKTIGVLRANAVKASPNDKDSAKRSFLACVNNGDWEHAQQIAASMDKNFPKERSFHFRNILTTYLFALSLKDSDPQKSAMFKMLSRRQIEKAKELRDKAPSQSGFPDRAISNEEEMLLWWKIQLGNAKERSELIPLVASPENGAVKQLAEGHITVFQEMMGVLEEAGAWDLIFAIGRDIFDKGIPLMVGEENKNVEDVMEQLSLGMPGELTEAQKATMSSAYRSAATDWGFWRQFITAADEQVEAQKARKQTREYLERISKGIKLRSIHKKQLDLANMRILFGRSSQSDSVPDSSRIGSLVAYVVTHYRDVACFEDLKGYLEHVSFEELKQLLQQMGEESSKPENDQLKNTMLLTLRLRIHYLFTTSTKYYTTVKGGGGMTCNFCDSPATLGRCETCLKSIAQSCIWNYNKGLKQAELQQTLQSEDVDPFSDMTTVGVLCLLKLAYSQAPWESFETAPLAPVEPKLLLQALIWIDAQYHIRARKNMVLALLLTKLYLLVGAVSYAKTLWGSLEVKNVTLDSLGPLFSDRLSSIAPGLWSANGEKQSPMMPYLNYYTNATRKSIPSSLGHAFEHGNVASILQILETDERIKKSCTMISSIVEDLRGTRAVGGKIIIEVRDDPLVESIRPNMTLYNATDFGSLPNHELPSSRPIQDLISIGPGLSAERAHLSLLSEWFMGVVAYREAKEFKPNKAPAVWEADRAVIAEACLSTRQSMENILHKKEVASLLTHPELSYYRLISSLAAYISQCAGKPWTRNASRPESSVAPVVREELSSQMLRLSALPANGPDSTDVLHAFSSLHATGMLRESALAALVVVRLLERMKSLDAKWETPKWLAEDLKSWGDEVAEAHKVVRERVKTLNKVTAANGWTGRLAEWAFGDLVRGTKQVSKDADDSEQSDFDMLLYKAIGQGAGVEHAPGQILRSWQDVARGWATVKLD